ncbi:MAG: hypothetical protein HYX47_18455 [Burkholderiales bacterium]|nr:hypothetical protein [Burkholderiales bacterium]
MGAELVVEDELSEAILKKILFSENPNLGINAVRLTNGFGQIKKNLRAYNSLARIRPVIVLTDQDNVACAPALLQDWFQNLEQAPHLTFRIASRETESWVMADRGAFAEFLGIQVNLVSGYPDQLLDPKQSLLELAASSPSRNLRKAMLPSGTTAKIGPGYNDVLSNFVAARWSPTRAGQNSPSLLRAMTRIGAL